ncbi:MAG: GNAT family N-acetyltransferase [Phototrophicaceae bacterium]
MPITEQAILEALDSKLFLSADYPESISVPLNIEGVYGVRSVQSANADANFVGFTRLTEDNVLDTIEAVQAVYDAHGHQFLWSVSDLSTPSTLAQHLESAGFVKAFDLVGMVRNNLQPTITVHPNIRVRIATDDDFDAVNRLYRDAYPLNEDEVQARYQSMQALGGHDYLAYVVGKHQPVSVASMFYERDDPIATLQGAATLEAYRGKGLYTALVAHRIEVARRDGIEAVVLQAISATSAPILAKLSFEKTLDISFYRSPISTNLQK